MAIYTDQKGGKWFNSFPWQYGEQKRIVEVKNRSVTVEFITKE